MASAALEHLNGNQAKLRIELAGTTLTIGRDPQCDIQVESLFDSVSRRHATLTKGREGWLITDTSTHGTFVNGERLQPGAGRLLLSSDLITLGGITKSRKDGKEFRFQSDITGTMSLEQLLRLGGARLAQGIEVDANRRVLLLYKSPLLQLSRLESRFFSALVEGQGRVRSYEEIRANLWPDEPRDLPADEPDRERIASVVLGLRRKVAAKLGDVDLIEAVSGEGYRLRV